MRTLKKALHALQQSQYLQTFMLDCGESVRSVKLLTHGLIFQRQLQYKLENSHSDTAHCIPLGKYHPKHNTKGIQFLFSEEFHSKYEHLRRSTDLQSGIILFKSLEDNGVSSGGQESFRIVDADSNLTLVSEYFVTSSRMLETFYSIQRERKIWWMRYSANPSRYTLDTYKTDIGCEIERLDVNLHEKCLSVKIKSVFPFGDIEMEHITLIPISELKIFGEKPLDVALIRTTVNVNVATYALLLDGIEHDRAEETLLLHRQLAPFQCLLVQDTDKKHDDMNDLCRHIELVLQRGGLRVLSSLPHAVATKCLTSELRSADNLGVNYIIVVNNDSMKTGRLGLRNRDTTLCETIHISDLPTYLVNIFSC